MTLEDHATFGASLLRPVTAAAYLEAGVVRIQSGRVRFKVLPSWPAAGEDRLGYSQLVRLIEVVREYHWKSEVVNVGGRAADSIVKRLEIVFDKPVQVGHSYEFEHWVSRLGTTSYDLAVLLRRLRSSSRVLTARICSVIIDPETLKPCRPFPETRLRLLELLRRGSPL